MTVAPWEHVANSIWRTNGVVSTSSAKSQKQSVSDNRNRSLFFQERLKPKGKILPITAVDHSSFTHVSVLAVHPSFS